MGRRQRFVASLIETYLGEGFAARRRGLNRLVRGRGAELELFHQVDDPSSYLLVQLLGGLVRGAGVSLAVYIVPAPAPEVDPKPALRRRHALVDARELARRYELRFPAEPSEPSTESVLLANAIMMRERDALAQLDVAVRVGAALFAGDRAGLEAIAAVDGRVEASSVARGLRHGRDVLRAKGHYAGGMLRFEGEWFWGVDRVHYLEARLREQGRAARHLLVEREQPAPAVVQVHGSRPPLEMYFSFRSPYAYLALERAQALSEQYAVELIIKPVLPMVMRGLAVPREKRLYIARDAAREARRLGIPFGRICDPLGVGVERCLAVFELAEREGLAFAFTHSAARGIWSEALDMANDDDLSIVVRRAGLEWSKAQRALSRLGWRTRAEQHRLELAGLGLWGVPSFRLGDYTCWGQDRLDSVEDRLAWLWWSEPESRPQPPRVAGLAASST
jgi:2-hydroxychromene-2-carboxylate isomerase